MKTICIALTAGCLTLAGCASTSGYRPPKIDNTPTHPTAVVHADTEIQGAILPNFHGTVVAYTRPDRRAIDNESKVDSWWARLLVNDLHSADIFRMDQNRAMKVNFDEQQYYECGINNCPSLINLLDATSNRSADHEDDDYDPEGTESCPLELAKHEFTVVDTGQSKTLNGFPVHLYQATWQLIYEDDARRQDQDTLKIDFWTTPPTGEVRKVWAIHQQATDAYLKDADLENNPLAEFLPEDVFRALSAFSGDTDSSSQQWNSEVTRKLATVKGYPIKINLNWYLDSNACPGESQQAADSGSSDAAPLTTLENMASRMVKGAVEDQFTPDEADPIFTYRYAITSTKVEQVHDSVFEVPEGFAKKPLPEWLQDGEH